jgi:hypothetical protein
MHAYGEAQGDTMEACVHRMLYCSAVQSSVDEFRSQDFGLKAELGSTYGIGLGVFYSVSRMERCKTRVDKVRYWTAVARLFRGIDLCRSESMEAGSMEELDLVMRIPVTTY